MQYAILIAMQKQGIIIEVKTLKPEK